MKSKYNMNCNNVIHGEIAKEIDYINCPFCYKQISNRVKVNRYFEC